jgi:2-methylcitrate dehydratase PrpD
MDVNYARLCLGYLVATWLLQGRVGLADFDRAALDDPERLALAQCVVAVPNDCNDPNALAPQRVTLRLHDGRELAIDLPAVLGHPQRPLSAGAQRAKFDACCAHAGLSDADSDALHAACQGLADLSDVAALVQQMHPSIPH